MSNLKSPAVPRKELRELANVADLRAFIADLPADMPLCRLTTGHCLVNKAGVSDFVSVLHFLSVIFQLECPMSTYPFTAEQQAVIDSDVGILAVDAFAGTGKTSTLEGFTRAQPRARILYTAFNRSIAQSAKERFPSNVECRTTHSLAFAAAGREYVDKLGNPSSYEISQRMNVPNRRAKQALDTISAWLCLIDAQIGPDYLPQEAQDYPQFCGEARGNCL